MNRIAILLSVAVLGLSSSFVAAGDYKLGSLEIEQPYARATPPNAPVSGGYMTIRNSGAETDRLISGEADFADRVEIHEMAMEGDVMKMRQLTDGLEIPGRRRSRAKARRLPRHVHRHRQPVQGW
jgi:copper(I)-binding protein